MPKKLENVLSLFDGLSSGQIALGRAGLSYDNYYASEINNHSIAEAMINYPDTLQPKDRNINLVDILEKDIPIKGFGTFNAEELNKASIIGRRLNAPGKRADYDKSIPIIQYVEVRGKNMGKSNCLTTVAKDNVLTPLPVGRHPGALDGNLPYRHYTPLEYTRLQTIPDDYFKVSSPNQIRRMCGEGWTIDVIAHMLQNII